MCPFLCDVVHIEVSETGMPPLLILLRQNLITKRDENVLSPVNLL